MTLQEYAGCSWVDAAGRLYNRRQIEKNIVKSAASGAVKIKTGCLHAIQDLWGKCEGSSYEK